MRLGMGELGWTPDVFWSSTLPDLYAALRGRRESQQEQYWHTGHLIAALQNVNGGKDGRPVRAIDIFPFLKNPDDPAPVDGDVVWQMEAYVEDEAED